MWAFLDRFFKGVPGEPRAFQDERLGTLETVVRGDKPGKWFNWEGQLRLAGQREVTWLSLSGDSGQPYRQLLEEVHRVLDHWDEIATKASGELRRGGVAAGLDGFRLLSIGDWDQYDHILILDLVPVGPQLLERDVEFYWPGDSWRVDHHVVLRARSQ